MGKLALFCVAVSILCSLLTADNIPVDAGFDPTKFYGKWYPILTRNFNQPPPEKIFTFTAEPLTDGAFSIKVGVPENGVCRLRPFVFRPIRPGYFESDDGTSSVHIIETDYYCLICVFKMDNMNLLQLLATRNIAPREWEEKFNTFAQQLNYNAGEARGFFYSSCTREEK